MARQLLEAILDQGVANPHYFEGRLLTATALREDQLAHRARQRQLGRGLGPGVVEGLWVGVEFAGSSTEPPLLSVTAGLAINGDGQTLALPGRDLVALSRTTTTMPMAGADLFKTCEPPTQQVEGSGEGFYVLVVAPASGFRGRAPASGLSDPMAGAGCGSQWAVEGVRFRLVPLDPLAVAGLSTTTRQLLETQLLGATADPALSQLRNVIAHLCLGSEPLATFPADPFGRETGPDGSTEAALADYGALDALIDQGLLNHCDVPLALVHWRLSSVAFVDNWSVRRRLSPAPTSDHWPLLTGGRRQAEGEAMLFQFQEQLAAVIEKAVSPSAIRAVDYFRWLPPAGVLPVAGGAAGKVVNHVTFFDTIVYRAPVFLEGARLEPLLHASLRYPAFDLSDPTMVWIYGTRESSQALSAGGTTVPLASYIFASGQLPYYASARFDVSQWDYSNFSASFDEGVFA